jgi:Cdc6-like AAA superfamily ATPase
MCAGPCSIAEALPIQEALRATRERRKLGPCRASAREQVKRKGTEGLERSNGGGRAEMERRIIERSLEDEDFRQRLLEDPQDAGEETLGTRLPEGIQVRAVEESADTIYLVLPSASPVDEVGELSDRELDAVAGAGWAEQMTSDTTCPTYCAYRGC